MGYHFTNEGFRKTLYRIVTHANEWESARALEEKRKPVLLNEKITCHWFRHTFATNLVLREVPYDTAKMVMGHSSIKTTVYLSKGYNPLAKFITKLIRHFIVKYPSNNNGIYTFLSTHSTISPIAISFSIAL